jgi:hypothetical protein
MHVSCGGKRSAWRQGRHDLVVADREGRMSLGTMDKPAILETLQAIADDMEADAKAFDGRPFDGRTVAEYFGNQGAAIRALALAVKKLFEDAK